MKKLLITFITLVFISWVYADGITIQSRGAKKGVNDDITSMTGLDNDGIPLAKVANAASDGANSDIKSISGLTTPLTVPQGGQGSATLADGGLLVGADAAAVEVVAAGATTEVLVGGGAGTNPVWTTATGTGSPVRADSPTFTTQITSPLVDLGAGGDVKFPATAAMSADANTLDDYEEGVWTPAVTFGGGATGVTYDGGTAGYYTKIGRQITVTGQLFLTNKGSSNGDALITGLPFTSLNSVAGRGGVHWAIVSNVSYANMISGFTVGATTNIAIGETTEGGTFSTLTDADFTNGSQLIFSLTYFDNL
jgi:hypothetical protein